MTASANPFAVTAIRSGTVLVDGTSETIVAGQTVWSRSCPELRDPKVAPLFGLADAHAGSGLRRSQPPAVPRPWRLSNPAERLGIDVSDHDVQRTAEHESAHAAAAFLLGWEATGATLHADGGGGDCAVIHPRGLDSLSRDREFAVICAAARAHVGWRHYDTDRGDRRQAFDALSRHVTNPRDATFLMEAAREEAKKLVATGRFRFIARRVEKALLEHGQLDATQLGPLLREARRDYARAA
jgi:hypothetical protein